jgi:hypothetical protein
LLLAAALAHAAPPTPLSQALTGEAKAAYESGRLLFEDGDSRGALAKFSHSYDVSRDPRLLWNMAACEKELRHYARAATLIGRYLKEGDARLSEEQRQSALETQRALTAFYVTVKLTGVPEGATVMVDGAQQGRAPLHEPLLVDLGSRILRVEQPGFEPFEQRLEVAGGGGLEVAVTLKRSAAPATAARLSVTTSGARDVIAVDGKVVGTQRWEGQVPAGEHSVRVTAVGKKPYESHVQLVGGGSRSLQIALEAEGSSSAVWYWVAGGAVVVAGAAVGGYLLLKPGDAAGKHPEGRLATVYLPFGVSR